MRTLIGLSVAAVALLVGMLPSEAQSQREPRQFCSSGNRANGGMPECSFWTWEQCRGNLNGTDHCYVNPLWVVYWEQRGKAPQHRARY